MLGNNNQLCIESVLQDITVFTTEHGQKRILLWLSTVPAYSTVDFIGALSRSAGNLLPHVGSFDHLRSPSIPIYAISKGPPPRALSLADNIKYKIREIISCIVQRSAKVH